MQRRYPDDFLLTDDWASLIFCRVVSDEVHERRDGSTVTAHMPLGYITVVEPHRFNAKRKLAGGHKAGGETPQETAAREFRGETGIHQEVELFTLVNAACEWRERPAPHWSLMFETAIPLSRIGMMHFYDKENEGEIPEYYTLDEFYEVVRHGGFLPPHYDKLVRSELIWPMGRDGMPYRR